MILSTILAAAEAGAEAVEHEKSEAPFFIAGAVLAAFAVLLSVYGMRHPDFPKDQGTARGVMTLSILLVLTAMSAIVYVSN
jgi:hypothetical protein